MSMTTTRHDEHAEFAEDLNAFLDGELDTARRSAVQAHVDTCDTCHLELEQLRVTRQHLRALPALRAPRSFAIPAGVPAAAGRATPGVPATAEGGWVQGWLSWGWRLGSLGAAVCLMMALVTAGLTPVAPGPAGFAGARAPAEPEAQARGAPLAADRTTAQRVAPPAPAQDQGLTGQGSAAAAREAAPAAPAPAPAAGVEPRTGAGEPVGSVSQAPAARTAPGARALSTWLTAAALLGVGSAALFVVERRRAR